MPEQKPLSFDEALAAVTPKPASKSDLSFEDALAQIAADTAKPSEGYWEDRGIAGKVWHPASGVSERNRADNQVLGLPPEIAATIVAPVGAALVQGGIDTATKVGAGAKAAIGVAGPILKYEAVKHGLRALGVPWWAAEGAGIVASGYRGGAKAAEEAAATEAVAIPKGDPNPLSPLELTRKLRAEHQARTGATKLAAPEIATPAERGAEAAVKTKYTAEEMAAGMKLIAGGKTAKEAEQIILAARELRLKWGLPTDANVADVVRKANESGRMTR